MKIIYDIEVYPNVFTCTLYNPDSDKYLTFEISSRVNQRSKLEAQLDSLNEQKASMVGFNNLMYDYPVLDFILVSTNDKHNYKQLNDMIYQKSMSIINTPWKQRWSNKIYDEYVDQIDLLSIHHFDNPAKATSLKLLEFNMVLDSIQELPFSPGTVLTSSEIDQLIDYNKYDVYATNRFYEISKPMIEFRESMGHKFTNYNDTKIGSDIFISHLEDEGVQCYTNESGKRQPKQTHRDEIVINDLIFDYINFESDEFNAVLDWLRQRVIKTTKGVFTELDKDSLGDLQEYANLKGPKGTVKNLNCVIDGFQFDFGTGGIHGSVESTIIDSDEDYMILDMDVTSLYPSIAISNTLFPEHLGEKFVDIYDEVKQERLKFDKGTPENASLKLALNGVYGKSNDKYSPFYDPAYTMAVTINGQLLLCMLSEQIMVVPDLELIQINTDGITVKFPRVHLELLRSLMFDWELETGLVLEEVIYQRFCVRDVNNYIAVYTDGSLKRKGVYEYNLGWHQNHSALVVRKAAEAALVYGDDIEKFILSHNDGDDFFLRTKVNKTSDLLYGDMDIQKVSRYYIAKDGHSLTKVMPPLKGKVDNRRFAINKGCLVRLCNDNKNIDWSVLDYDWYISEAKKLVEPLWAKKHELKNEYVM